MCRTVKRKPRVRQRKDEGRYVSKIGYSRLELIANVEGLFRIDSGPLAGSEVDFRSRFLNPFLRTYQDRVKEWEYLESIERLDCAGKAPRRPPLAYRSHDQSMKGTDNDG